MAAENQPVTSGKATGLALLGVGVAVAVWLHAHPAHTVQKQVVVVHDTVTKVIQQHSAFTSGDKTAIAIVAIVLAFGALCVMLTRGNG